MPVHAAVLMAAQRLAEEERPPTTRSHDLAEQVVRFPISNCSVLTESYFGLEPDRQADSFFGLAVRFARREIPLCAHQIRPIWEEKALSIV